MVDIKGLRKDLVLLHLYNHALYGGKKFAIAQGQKIHLKVLHRQRVISRLRKIKFVVSNILASDLSLNLLI